MDKKLETKIKDRARAFRSFECIHKREEETNEMIVEGYAANFNQETVLFRIDDEEYKEVIDRGAFDGADMSDVVLNYNHQGKVIARTRNNTLSLSIDEKGLKATARLSGTQEGRNLYEEINGGYLDKMSFQFVIKEEDYDSENRTWTIKKIGKVYDVSAVDFPAYQSTELSARSRLGHLEQSKKNIENKKKILYLKTLL